METSLLEREAPELTNGATPDPPQEPEILDFGDFLSAEPRATRLHFTMGGKECWVDLVPMDAADDEAFQTMGLTVRVQADGTVKPEGDIDLPKRQLFLVSRTVYDYLLYRSQRTKEGGTEWYQVTAPQGNKSSQHYRNALETEVQGKFRKDRRFWAWICERCQEVNGYQQRAEGN